MRSLDGLNSLWKPWHHDLLGPHLKKILQQILADQGLQEGASLVGSTFIQCLLCTNPVLILNTFNSIADHSPRPRGFASLTIKVLQTSALGNKRKRRG